MSQLMGGEPDKPAPLTQYISVKYPDQPHDCEAVAVDPTQRAIFLLANVEAGREAPLFRVPLPRKLPEGTLHAELVAELPMPGVRAMDISRDGLRLVLSTHEGVFQFTRDPDQPWAQAVTQPPRRLAESPHRAPTGLCFAFEGPDLFLAVDQRQSPLWRIPRQPRQ